MSARIFNDVVVALIVGIVGALVISTIGRMIIKPMERRTLARMYEENESERT